MNARLKQRHIDNGWTQECELKLTGCLKAWALTWAHSRKSRFLTDDEKWMEAALCCVACHDRIESMDHRTMYDVVIAAIARRP